MKIPEEVKRHRATMALHEGGYFEAVEALMDDFAREWVGAQTTEERERIWFEQNGVRVAHERLVYRMATELLMPDPAGEPLGGQPAQNIVAHETELLDKGRVRLAVDR